MATQFNANTDMPGNGVDPGSIRDAYLSGDYAKTNALVSKAGMSEAGATNAGGNMGYSPADIAEMKSKGIIFAAAGTPAEEVGWNGNANMGQQGTTSLTQRGGIVNSALNPNSVQSATAERIGAPTAWNVTPDQTVEGRINSITQQNNPLMVQARTQADEQSNQRGLINSSMAVTSGQDAMYRAAVPIATADAATAAKAAGYNADEQNQVAMKNADMANQIAQANLGANTSMYNAKLGSETSLATAQLGSDTQKAVAALNADSQQKIATLDAATRTQIQTLQNQNSTLLNTNQQASAAFNQYVVAAANIQNNPNLDAANKTAALQTLWQTTQTQLQVLAHVSGLDLTGMLDMTQFNNPIVTPAPTPAPVGAPVEHG